MKDKKIMETDKWGLREQDYEPQGYYQIPKVEVEEEERMTREEYLAMSQEKREKETQKAIEKEAKRQKEMIRCVMCNKEARFIAVETKEPLCEKCRGNNDEARRR